MADDVDISNDRMAVELAEAIERARKPLPAGKPGDCDLCGEHSMRLVDGVCAPCRDRYGVQ